MYLFLSRDRKGADVFAFVSAPRPQGAEVLCRSRDCKERFLRAILRAVTITEP